MNSESTAQPAEIGPWIAKAAHDCGDPVDIFCNKVLTQPMAITIEDKQGNPERVLWIPGHRAEARGTYGPFYIDDHPVMVIGKMPWKDEVRSQHLFDGASGEILCRALRELQMNYDSWYLTNVLRFMPSGGKKGAIPVQWARECRWFLDREIEKIQPRCILLLGSEAVKELLGRKATLKKYRGTVSEYAGIPVVTAVHPAAVASEPNLQDAFKRDLELLKSLVTGEPVKKIKTTYEFITTEERLKEVVNFYVDLDHRTFTIDCEWGSLENSSWLQAKLRSVQFSPGVGVGYCVRLRSEGLVDSFNPSPKAAMPHLKRLLCREGVELTAHGGRSDVKYLKAESNGDVDILPYFKTDTMLMYNLLYSFEDGFGLENLTVRYTDLGRYELELDRWLEENVKKKDRKLYLKMYGYAFIPDAILCPYGCKDVDSPARVKPILENELKSRLVKNPYDIPGIKDSGGNPARVQTLWDIYRFIVHPANYPLNEIETIGMLGDRTRLEQLVVLFAKRYEELKVAMQELLHWPTFNPRSDEQMAELLFGDQPVKGRIRSPEATALYLQPVKTTDKPSKDWSKIDLDDWTKGKVRPSTDSETVKILVETCEDHEKLAVLKQVQRIKYVDQITKNFLRQPKLNPLTGNREWTGGLMSEIDIDGRIRTTLLQLTETGRYSSSNPNLQLGGCKTLRIAGISDDTSTTA